MTGSKGRGSPKSWTRGLRSKAVSWWFLERVDKHIAQQISRPWLSPVVGPGLYGLRNGREEECVKGVRCLPSGPGVVPCHNKPGDGPGRVTTWVHSMKTIVYY